MSADIFKKLLELRGSIPDPVIRSGDTVSRNIGMPVVRTDGGSGGCRWSVYGHVIAEFSRINRFSIKLSGFELGP